MAVQAMTKKADKLVVGQSVYEIIREMLKKGNAERLLNAVHALEEKVNAVYSGKYGYFPKIENKPFYYFTKGNFYIPDLKREQCPNNGDIPTTFSGVPTTSLTENQFKTIFDYHSSCPLYSGYNSHGSRIVKNKDGNEYLCIAAWNGSYWYPYHIYDNGSGWNAEGGYRNLPNLSSNVLRLPISAATGFFNAIKYDLMPADLTAEEKALFALLVGYQKKTWLVWQDNAITGFSDQFFKALKKDGADDFGEFLFKNNSILQHIQAGKKVKLTGDGYQNCVKQLVNVDHVRINLSPYEESRLTDPNGGHWDLWEEKAGENEILLHLENAFYGRNPAADVRHDGIVGIDFGTKSTVVTFQNGTDTIAPMRIGCGDYKKDASAKDYENPTVMEFIDLDKFLSRYKASASRPDTEWVDLTISHTAADNLNTPQSGSEYYAWFNDLKQWASDKNRKIILKDKKGKEIELSPFVDINESDLNPIELYAYLLGLFINNMYNGIYLNYILSFPVTYERRIRQKIAASFSNGLKKSLPKPVLEDKNTMALFRVMEGASEPAAYAVCALQEYGFQPEEGEKILYGIFDFGGGTTDFDFGTWQRAPKNLQRRYDYVIKHFGAGGDRLLGGENLLELLAYSVFKQNEKELRENEIQFLKPADAEKYCGMFEGSEALISDSQQAKINQRQLAEKLRPLWHGESFEQETIKLNLYSTKGEVKTIALKVSANALREIIRKRIDSGVENFFEAMSKAVTEEVAEGVQQIHIFLAGNSSQSAVVQESFDHFRKKYEAIFAKKLNVKTAASDLKPAACDYFVKKYGDIWEDICYDLQDTESWGYLEDENEIWDPQNDKFISKLDEKQFTELLWSVWENAEVSAEDLLNDLYELWAEGVFSVSIMTKIADEDVFISEEVSTALDSFIYGHAEVPDKVKAKIKSSYHDVKLSSIIADKTSKALQQKQKNTVFTLYPPLGTEQSDTLRTSRGLTVSDSIARPTGKTGVAYGLLECRPGSRIKVESEIKDTDEIKFNFYTGYASMGKFVVVTDRDIAYGKWIEFIDASESDFELYYTDLPEAVGNQMSINGVSRKICRIDETMDNAMVYVRAVEPSVMEFCAALDEEKLNNQEYLSKPKRIILE